MNLHNRRIQHKKKKAQRNLEKMLNYYSHNSIVLQLQVTNYIHRFNKNDRGEINPDVYIRGYILRVEDKMRDIAE